MWNKFILLQWPVGYAILCHALPETMYGSPDCFVARLGSLSRLVTSCRAKRQWLITWKLISYCLLVLHGRVIDTSRRFRCLASVPCPANTRHSPSVVSMLAQRRRRCANIETALGECPCSLGALVSPNPVNLKRVPRIIARAGDSVTCLAGWSWTLG